MKVGILSDTHDQVERTAGAVALLAGLGAETLIHCGDLTTPEIVHACAALPCHYVLGNNDYDEEGLRRVIAATGGICLGWAGTVQMAGKSLGVTHGHLAREFRQLIRQAPDYLLYGHVHYRLDERDGPTRQINPGALHRAPEWTVALLDLTEDSLIFHEVR
jgi:putative phosphoesterase